MLLNLKIHLMKEALVKMLVPPEVVVIWFAEGLEVKCLGLKR
jgi:hypothetical protein